MPQQQQRTDQSTILHCTRRMGGSAKTHEEKHPIGVPFPTFYHVIILFPGPTEIHREQSFRTIGKVGLSRQALILLGRCRNGWVSMVILTLLRIDYRFLGKFEYSALGTCPRPKAVLFGMIAALHIQTYNTALFYSASHNVTHIAEKAQRSKKSICKSAFGNRAFQKRPCRKRTASSGWLTNALYCKRFGVRPRCH